MALETIQVVKQAELEAENQQKEALLLSKDIIAKAEKQGKELISSMVKEATEEAKKAERNAEEKASIKKAEAAARVEQNIKILQDQIREKEEKAVELVIAALVS